MEAPATTALTNCKLPDSTEIVEKSLVMVTVTAAVPSISTPGGLVASGGSTVTAARGGTGFSTTVQCEQMGIPVIVELPDVGLPFASNVTATPVGPPGVQFTTT